MGRQYAGSMAYQVEKSDAEWREQLSKDEYAVLRKAGTERPFTGEYTDTKTVGVYHCRACNAELFRSETKFDSHCGWPPGLRTATPTASTRSGCPRARPTSSRR